MDAEDMFGGMDGGFGGGGMNIDPSVIFNMMNGGTASFNFGTGGAGGRKRPGPHDFSGFPF